MKPKLSDIPLQQLRERFEYNPDTGSLTYLKNFPPRGRIGESAIFQPPKLGRSYVSIGGNIYKAARVIWYLMTGEDPSSLVMFKDRDFLNTRWDNLATTSANPRHLPTQVELQEFYHYDSNSGLVSRKKIPYYVGGVRIGDKVGNLDRRTGVLTISLNRKAKPLTHLIWCYMTGRYPEKGVYVDHKDRNPLNNRWDNLRAATHQQNCANLTDRKTGKRPFRGVKERAKTGNFYAECQCKGVRHYGPSRLTAEEAHQDYIELHKRLHGEFSNYVDEVKT